MDPNLEQVPAKNILCRDCKNESCMMRLCLPTWQALLKHEKEAYFIARKGYIFRQDEPVQGIFFILNGKVKVTSTGKQGREQIIRFAKAGDILGHRGFSSGEKIYRISAVALEDTIVCFIPTSAYLDLLHMNNELAYSMLFFYAEELGKMDAWLRKMVELTMKQKVADALLMVYEAFGTGQDGRTLAYQISRRDIANTAGSVPDVVSRLLAELARDGVLALQGKKIIVPDFDKLREAAGMA